MYEHNKQAWLSMCLLGSRRDITLLDEQLAMQHAKVLQLEQKGATDQEQLLSEKIAEKQLKIKQVKEAVVTSARYLHYYTCLFLQTRLSQQLVNVEHHQKLQQPFTSPGARSPTNTAISPVNTVSPHQQPRPPAVKTISPISNSKPQQVWSMCTYPCIVVES